MALIHQIQTEYKHLNHENFLRHIKSKLELVPDISNAKINELREKLSLNMIDYHTFQWLTGLLSEKSLFPQNVNRASINFSLNDLSF